MQFNGQSAIVTGGASGIGHAIAGELVSRGCRVAVVDIDRSRAEAVAKGMGGHAVGFGCDVSDHAAVEGLRAVAEGALGPIGLVFANAGVGVGGPLVDADPRELDWVFGVNVRGVWNVASVFARRMIQEGREGRLCLTASEHALGFQHAGMGFYTASKHAVLGLAEVFRAELPASIGISVFCPGLVATQLHLAAQRSPVPKPDAERLKRGAALMARGMPADEVARAAVDGVARGHFLIVTHPTSLAASNARYLEVAAAFAAQAPWSAEADRYDIKKIIAAVAEGGD